MKECCKTYLNEQFDGDEEVVGMIYDEYVTSIADKLNEADTTLAQGAWDALDKVAHTIKGNALAVGDQEMADAGIALRAAAKLMEADKSAQLIARMREFAATL